MKVQTKKRDTDPGKWWDPWFRKLDKGSRLLLLYLFDVCDIAGFVSDFDYEIAAEDTAMDATEIESCMDILTRTYKGTSKVLCRTKEGPSKVLTVYVTGFVKFQQNTDVLNPANRCHLGIIRRLEEWSPLFPEIKDLYRTLQGPTKPPGKVRYGKVKERECEREKTAGVEEGPQERLVSQEDLAGDELWLKVKSSCLELGMDQWLALRRAWEADGDMEWSVGEAVAAAEQKKAAGSPVNNAWAWLQSFMQKGARRKAEKQDVLSDDDILKGAG